MLQNFKYILKIKDMDIIAFNDKFNIFYKQFKSINLKDCTQKLDIFDKINCRYIKYDIMIKFY